MADQEVANLAEITPEQFAQLVTAASDADIETALRSVGLDTVLARIFDGFRERFVPAKAEGVTADVQFVVSDGGKEYPYVVSIADGACTVSSGRADNPKSTLSTDLVSFCRLIAGQIHGPQLFMAGKLKVGGDLLFSTRVETFFERPKV